MSNPTHLHKLTGALVFPEGYDPADLEELDQFAWQEHEHANALVLLRQGRDAKLDASDKLMLPDRGFSEETQQSILRYREALRNITEGDVFNPQWPTDPTTTKKK